jgi:phosphatidylglycerophosphate synthase
MILSVSGDLLLQLSLGFSVAFGTLNTILRVWKMWRSAAAKGPKPKAKIAANNAGKFKLVMETIAVSLCLLGFAMAVPTLVTVGIWTMVVATGLAAVSLYGQVRTL